MSITWDVSVPDPEFVGTEEEARELLRLCMRKVEEDPDDYIGFDTETHGKTVPIKQKPLDWMSDTVTYWSLAFDMEQGPRRWCITQEYFNYFSPLLENPKANFAGWNVKYDAHISWNCGINIWNARQVVDGLALANLHDENRRAQGLKTCAADWCGLHMTPYKSLFDGIKDRQGKKAKEFDTSLIELADLGHINKVSDYASYDAYAHLRTVQQLIQYLDATPIGGDDYSLWQYFLDMEIYFTEMLWRMERRGMGLDLDYLKGKVPIIQKQIDKIERDISRMSGRLLNINSPKQLAAYLFLDDNGLKLKPVKLTDTQQPSTDEEVMNILTEAGVEIATKIVQVRKLGKTKGTYMDALIAMAEYYFDGRIHPSFNQFGARTGRLSTKNPNSQNFPRPATDIWGIRRAFIAGEGKKLIVADYEQIEMRIMADLSKDPTMLQAIHDGKDLHSFTVALTTPGVKYEEVVAAKKSKKPDDRQKWLQLERQGKKAVGFGIIYGAGPPKISESIEISEADWQAAIDDMPQRTFERRANRLMKNNPILTAEQAIEKVGRHSVAGDKIKEYFEAFPGVKGFMDQTPEMCRHTMYYDENNDERIWDFKLRGGSKEVSESGHSKRFGYVQTLCGRYRRLEDIDHKNFFYKSEAQRQAVNTRVQGGAADITKAAMLRIEHDDELNMLGVRVLNQVHDEIVMDCPEENAEIAAPRIAHFMENPFGDDQPALSVPIPVDLKIVDNWSEAK